jgi:hypothetical protein
MTEFKHGDKVRVNEGELEGKTGTVVDVKDNMALVKLDGILFGEGDIAFYTDVLVSSDENHEALSAALLYPDLGNESVIWRLTTFVDGIMYQSLPIDYKTVKSVLGKPPAGLYAVECIKKAECSTGQWRTIWKED